jgi:hypothetical protein
MVNDVICQKKRKKPIQQMRENNESHEVSHRREGVFGLKKKAVDSERASGHVLLHPLERVPVTCDLPHHEIHLLCKENSGNS